MHPFGGQVLQYGQRTPRQTVGSRKSAGNPCLDVYVYVHAKACLLCLLQLDEFKSGRLKAAAVGFDVITEPSTAAAGGSPQINNENIPLHVAGSDSAISVDCFPLQPLVSLCAATRHILPLVSVCLSDFNGVANL